MSRPKKVVTEKPVEQAHETHNIVEDCVKPKSFLECLEGMKEQAEKASVGVLNRELSLALADIVKHLDSAIGLAKFAEEAIKVNKLDVTL